MLQQKQLEKVDFQKHKYLYDVHDFAAIEAESHEPSRQLALLSEMGGVQGLAAALRTNLESGLYEDEVKDGKFTHRREAYGKNVYPTPPAKSWFAHALDLVGDPMLIILFIAGSISLILGAIEEPSHGWIDGLAIFVAIGLVTCVGATNNVQQDKRFRALDEGREPPRSMVIRAGKEVSIQQSEIVVGDILTLTAGEAIVVDACMVTPSVLKVDRSSLTGEAVDVIRDFKAPFLESGSSVREGECICIVTGVGIHTRYGRIMATLAEELKPTPLQLRLEAIAELIGKVGGGVALVLFFSLLIKWMVTAGQNDSWDENQSEILDYFIISVTLIVVAVPEGLPLAVTISLAYSLGEMAKEQNLVKVLSACETMGNATTVCSDKTGTLTQNKMTVVETFLAGQLFQKSADASGATVYGRPPKSFWSSENTRWLVEGIVCNCRSRVDEKDRKEKQPESWKWQKGNQTDQSVCAWVMGYNNLPNLDFMDLDKVREDHIFEKAYPFDSGVKRSSIIFKTGAGYRQYFMGASERILQFCSAFISDSKGGVAPVTPAKRTELEGLITGMASKGLRTLAFGYVDHKSLDVDAETGELTDPPAPADGVFIGVVGIEDPLRPTTKNAVNQCQRAGIVVRMVTGDHLATARSIAIDCDILTSVDHICMTGEEFRRLVKDKSEESKNKLLELIPRLRVLARSEPQDKMDLVTWLQEHNEIVGATGDGTNDAQALKQANVGIAMNIAGTDVAKRAADIIILDDRFASVVTAVKWGRSVYDNIRKFVQFQLTINTVALTLTLIGAWGGFVNPLTAVQLLWINLIMDTLAALALGTEKPTDHLLDRRPYTPESSLISKIMWRNIIGYFVYQLTVILIIMYNPGLFSSGYTSDCTAVDHSNGVFCNEDPYHYSLVFNMFVWLQIFNEINSRKCNDELNVFEQLFTNYMFHFVLVFTIIMQFLIMEYFGSFTDTVPLSRDDYLIQIGVAAGILVWGVFIRFIDMDITEEMIPPLTGKFNLDLPEWLERQK